MRFLVSYRGTFKTANSRSSNASFLSTSILSSCRTPTSDIEIRMMLAPGTIIPSDDASNVKYTLKGFSLQVESVSFGDGSYRAMVD